ncbi:hypothetical protein GPECTOR_9g553 [Gonium pectorale]|uniref:Protein kinase domain-containing protein n=1 Tax=Gonium pectorale TaxID=33097 RepID=A0A150GRP9_GONPE|nr:hypothetical protein GPECTOR_9g553 [Gonium pectorale]|eukprot:KXZ52509.1 hypothetical protein GPECTOR_9g553 [Gonium pectorale]
MAAYRMELAAYCALEREQGRATARLLSAGDTGLRGAHFIATEEVRGVPLSELSQPLPPGVAAAAVAALRRVHSAVPGLLHGDVRLRNFILRSQPDQAAHKAAHQATRQATVAAIPAAGSTGDGSGRDGDGGVSGGGGGAGGGQRCREQAGGGEASGAGEGSSRSESAAAAGGGMSSGGGQEGAAAAGGGGADGGQQVVVIDFGMSRLDGTERQQQVEVRQLEALLRRRFGGMSGRVEAGGDARA